MAKQRRNAGILRCAQNDKGFGVAKTLGDDKAFAVMARLWGDGKAFEVMAKLWGDDRALG
jgi:hypothetical protein